MVIHSMATMYMYVNSQYTVTNKTTAIQQQESESDSVELLVILNSRTQTFMVNTCHYRLILWKQQVTHDA